MTSLAVVKPYVGEMTDTCAAVTHLVTDAAAVTGRRAGRYLAVCEMVVVPGSLKESSTRCCRDCQAWAATQ
jgi:hypothetical protein